MRLLYISSDGKLEWTKDLIGDKIPSRYAILSHTWQEDQEVTFDDLKTLHDLEVIDAWRKAGWAKIRFCAQQAERDGLKYFWIDTCCIDRANNTELSEAINSMFRWYQNAERCYVLLPDVENNSSEEDRESSRRWKEAFRKSRWFTRGWTLQELLAPKTVEFFSKEGVRLGDKESLKHTIHDITRIPINALSGSDLSEFSIAERFSWADTRQTTREEDGAYCMLGILGICMSLVYGEGKDNAMKRLRHKAQRPTKDIEAAPVDDADTRSRDERIGKLCSWLSPPDASTNFHKAHKQRQAETGRWLLESKTYTEWKVNAASLLWLYGIPGCGKTVLSSTIIEHLLQHCENDTSIATAYFYFDFNDKQKQDPELMVRSLLCQLLQRLLTIPTSLDTFFSSCLNGQRQPPLEALLEVLQQTMQGFTQVYVVLDALDECAQREELMDVLATVAGWQLQNLHLLMTSRRERDIESSLKVHLGEEDTVCLQSDVVDEDIQRYVQQRLSSDKSLMKWDKDATLRQEVEATLMRGAHGMYRFRWAACQLDALGKCRSRAMLRKALATLPPTLDQTYDRILCAISNEDSKYALRILQWLTFSARPLSLEEIAEAAAIDVTRDPAFDRDDIIEDPLEILNICSSLVTLATDNDRGSTRRPRQIIALAHYSVQEYLVSDRIRQGQAKAYSMQDVACHCTITQACLQYLLQFQQPNGLPNDSLDTFALARYSAKFWSNHIQKTGGRMEETSRLALDLLSDENPAYFNWIRLYNPERPWDDPDLTRTKERMASPLYYAASLGLTTVVELLLEAGVDVNRQDGDYGNALLAASFGGKERVVKLLLDKGAEVNAQGGDYGNALLAASFGGKEQVVELLLEKGAEVNAQGGVYGNALQVASFGGNEQIVKLLLDKGANVNVPGRLYGNALQAASFRGNEQVVELLLDKGADINAQGGAYMTALQAASLGGYEQVVKLLLDKGADVNAPGRMFVNALQAASGGGREQIVKLLLDKGAEVNAQGKMYGNALQAASLGGYEQVVKLLLDKGAEVNAQGGYYGSALQAASLGGYEQVVKLLLDNGAEANVQGGIYSNALQAASARGQEQVVKLLLDKGADVNAQGGAYGHALQAASAGGQEQETELLFKKGVEVNAQGGAYSNALQTALLGGYEKVAKLLLDKGDKVNGQAGDYAKVQAASVRGYEQVVKLLLNRSANVNAQGGEYGSTLQATSERGYEQVVKLLLSKGANVNAQGGEYGNALQAASRGGHKQLVKLLLDAGARRSQEDDHVYNSSRTN